MDSAGSVSRQAVLNRRAEVKEIVAYLRSDLYERNRDYSASSFDVAPVEYDPETEMLWGSPLGWRVTIKVFEDQRIVLAIHKPDGFLLACSPPMDAGAVGWLEDYLP
jgi:hypothetical protein